MLTLSIIKADTGGFVGHSSMHPEMLDVARRAVAEVVGDLLVDAQVSSCGDDLHLIMTHRHGVEAEPIHAFAWDVFQQTTALAKRLGLYGAGQDLLSDAFSGNLRGMGPGYAELEFEPRPSETVLCFLADKTEPGAWNLPVYKMFADPFNTAGLVIDPKMHAGFSFEVHDLFENRHTLFDCPRDLYDMLLFIGAPSRYVIKQVTSKTLDEPAAVTSTQRLALMAGRYVGKDDPVLIVRSQSGTARGRRDPRAVRVPAHGRRLHARIAPRAADAGRPSSTRRRAGSTARRASWASASRSPTAGCSARATCSPTRPSTVPGGSPTRRWTTCAATGRSSRTGCRWTRWSTRRCPRSRSRCTSAGRRSPMRPLPASTAEPACVSRRPGRFRGESRVVVTTADGAEARGLWFAGRPALGLRPWADLDAAEPGALLAVAERLGPGGSIMVAYGGDDTERALRRRVPAAATPLGLALLHTGCRWLKDWYFAEGGREGHTKLQGELPLDATHRRRAERALREELEAFIADGAGTPADQHRAREALALIGPTTPAPERP